MTLRDCMALRRPGRGAIAWLAREAASSYSTIHKALRGEPINDRKAAERLSAATGGEVSVAELMQIFAPPDVAPDSVPPPA